MLKKLLTADMFIQESPPIYPKLPTPLGITGNLWIFANAAARSRDGVLHRQGGGCPPCTSCYLQMLNFSTSGCTVQSFRGCVIFGWTSQLPIIFPHFGFLVTLWGYYGQNFILFVLDCASPVFLLFRMGSFICLSEGSRYMMRWSLALTTRF